MITKQEWLFFLKKNILGLSMMFCCILSGCIYAAYGLKNGKVLAEMAKEHFIYHPDKVDLPFLLNSFWGYEKKILVIWLLSLIKYLDKLCLLLILLMVFAYGFALTVAAASLGFSENGLLFMTLFIQGVMMTGYLVSYWNMLTGQDKAPVKAKGYVAVVYGTGICILMTAVQVIGYLQ